MPVITVTTNSPVAENSRKDLEQISSTVAGMLGKPESYVMVMMQHNPHLIFAGTSDPAAYLECKSIGLPATETGRYSEVLSELIESIMGVPRARIYIEFANAERNMFGWNGGTF